MLAAKRAGDGRSGAFLLGRYPLKERQSLGDMAEQDNTTERSPGAAIGPGMAAPGKAEL